jgi:hypothetical protein
MRLTLQAGIPFVAVQLSFQGHSLDLEHVMLDTGSASSVFAADQVAVLGIFPSLQDMIYRIRGVGGSEFVFARKVDSLVAGELQVRDPVITIGAMNYGFKIYGILGMDFLLQARAMIDLHHLELLPANRGSE